MVIIAIVSNYNKLWNIIYKNIKKIKIHILLLIYFIFLYFYKIIIVIKLKKT